MSRPAAAWFNTGMQLLTAVPPTREPKRLTGVRTGETVPLRFDILADVPATNLSDGTVPVVFWELETKLDLPGLDFAERYAVPLYA